MALFSKTAELGLRACMVLAAGPGADAFLSTRRVAEELRVQPAFLTKVLRRLVCAGLLRAQRGPRGGVALARPADRVALLDLLTALRETACPGDCLFNLPSCGHDSPCPLRARWEAQRDAMQNFLAGASLRDWVGTNAGQTSRKSKHKERKR